LPAHRPNKPAALPAAKEKLAIADAKPAKKLSIKRRHRLERIDLCRQLLQVREIDSSSQPESRQRRQELAGLPFRMGVDCHLDKEGAENLQVLSQRLHNLMGTCMPGGDFRLDADKLRDELLPRIDMAHNPWIRDEAVPALLQILQPENTPVRLVLIDVLTRIPGPQATAALAKRAIYDLDPKVREAAVRGLVGRPREDYRAILLSGLRYLWAPVADHAAESLVALEDRQAVPLLKRLMAESDPAAPTWQEDATPPGYVVRELVRVNHLANCATCHPRSNSATDLVRAAIPLRGQPLSPSPYSNQSSSFIHADVTYLRPDFSVMQPVEHHNAWPAHQRFDYVVRERPATNSEIAVVQRQGAAYPQRAAVLFALNELTSRP
jgi:hypothetical protein